MTTTPTTPPTLGSITFDCTDARVAATFWSAALHRSMPADATTDYVQLAGDPALSFFSVPEAKTVKNRVHLDLDTDDLDAEVDRLVAIGATRLGDFHESGYRWTTLADPEGNEFDVVAPAA